MGPTQDRNPPLSPLCILVATDSCSEAKIEAGRLVEGSGIRHRILGPAAFLPTDLDLPCLPDMTGAMFDMPLRARCEIVLDIDVAADSVGTEGNLRWEGRRQDRGASSRAAGYSVAG